MGIVGSRLEDGVALHLKDQNRFSITSLTVTNSRRQTLLQIVPNAYPASKVSAKRDISDDSPVEFIQDPDSLTSSSAPSFLLRLNNDDDLYFNFTFVVRQSQSLVSAATGESGAATSAIDTFINGLTFAFASNSKDLDNLVTREFHADPNLHKNSNVELVGDYSTGGNPSVQFHWSWKWRPPKLADDKGGGWRNICTFVDYDQRAHRLNTLATFSFWIQNTQRVLISPPVTSPAFEMLAPPKLRIASAQSIRSVVSESTEGHNGYREPPSPVDTTDSNFPLIPNSAQKDAVKLDVLCQRPGEDMTATEDGPLFRATMKALEQKTGNMRTRMKKVLRKAEAAQAAQGECNDAVGAFMDALREAAISNGSAVQPVLEHYFEKIARQILAYERQNTVNLQKIIIDPLSKLYNLDIKQAEAKKKDFEDESKDYYAYVGRYLGQRQDSLKEKKRIESDSKYQSKRRNFELRRFDYSSFMQDLHGGRKDQEVLSQLTRYADTQARSYLETSKKVEEMIPQLEALIHEVKEADKEFQFQRTEREEKRRTLEKSTKQYIEPEISTANQALQQSQNHTGGPVPDTDLGRTESIRGNGLQHHTSISSQHGATSSALTANNTMSPPGRPVSGIPFTSPGQDRFRGIRDLEEKDHSATAVSEKADAPIRKEGLLWALSRPGSHADPRGLNKQAWHKYWIVLDQGRLAEYSNWKERLDLHADPIDLRMASVREARNAERRFCFEIITPSYKRVYQATSEDDMMSWINALNNALQSAVEGRSQPQSMNPSPTTEGSMRRDIGSILTGKTSSHSTHQSHHGPHHSPSAPSATAADKVTNAFRRTTVGARPTYVRTTSSSFEQNPSKLLQIIRDNDQGNCWCADCGSGAKTEWVSINLGIILCIECSGIHRSLGTHISKVRSLTLDVNSFTTDIVELLLQIGNRVSNMVWEAKLEVGQKLQPSATRDQRLKYITEKYVDRLFVNPISSTLSHYSTADETLLASVKKNDIQGVLYALALRANPNTIDRSRNNHSVFLALAAADPASPISNTGMHSVGSISSIASSASSTKTLTPSYPTSTVTSPRTPPSATSSITITSPHHPNQKVTPFPIAELLVQNGAEIPSTPPSFPLSASAQLYLDQKTGKLAGPTVAGTGSHFGATGSHAHGQGQDQSYTGLAGPGGAAAGPGGTGAAGGTGGGEGPPSSSSRTGSDMLSALPSIKGMNLGGMAMGMGLGSSSPADSRERDRDRSSNSNSKRSSAGGKFAAMGMGMGRTGSSNNGGT